jgi:hypothetical protein
VRPSRALLLVALGGALVLLACGGSSTSAGHDAATDAGAAADAAIGFDVGAPALCATYAEPVLAGTVAEPALTELSGLAASRRNPGVYYAHNDSGDRARFFALAGDGAALGELVLTGATATDWEDLAVGPCPTGWCVYLGDLGDNSAARTSYAIFRVPEPAIAGPVGTVEVSFERFPFVYPEGAHNCETLVVHPVTGDVYTVAKNDSTPALVHRYPPPLDAATTVTLETVGEVTIPTGGLLITGGDIHPTGARLLLRTYDHLWEFRADAGADFAAVLAATPLSVPVASETQGEAVAYTVDGRGYVTSSEGASPPLHRVDCAP